MDRFTMNGYSWRVCFVRPDDPVLVDRTGALTLATTDPSALCVYVSDSVEEPMLARVLVHELGHCALFSFGLSDDIRRMAHPRYWVEAEEWVCNFIADYGMGIFEIAHFVLGDDSTIELVSREIERLVA